MENNFFIIDGNAYIYRSFYAIPKLTNKKGFPTNAVYGFLQILIKILQEKMQENDKICVCFDASRKTFRNDLYPEYKANRDKMPDDLVLQVPVIKEAIDKIGITRFEKDGYEADDLIASLSQKTKKDYNVKIISSDKDILQLVDDTTEVLPIPKEEIINIQKFVEEFGFMPENMVDYLSIMGDTSDNVPGVKGIGKKGAQTLVADYKTIENIIQNIDKLNPSVKSKILESIEDLKISKELVKLKSNIDINFDIQNCSFSLKQNFEFKDFLEKLELFSISNRIFNLEKKEHKPQEINIKYTEKLVMQCFDEFMKKISSKEEIYISLMDNILYVYVCDENLYKILEEDISLYKPQIEQIFLCLKEKFIITDNAKNLYSFLKFHQINLKIKMFDLLFASYILDMSIQNTDSMIRKYASECFKKDIFANFMAFSKIYGIVVNELKSENVYEKFENIDMPFCEILSEMEENGVKIDTLSLAKFNQEIDKIINNLVLDIYKEAGEIFNINSAKQLSNILFNKLKLPVIKKIKTGYSTSEDVLVELAKQSNLPKKILDYREVIKLKNTYVEPILKLVDSNLRIHTTYNFTNTTTGRLSSTNPNLQNIPIKTELGANIRKSFIASDGYYLVSSDYSQIDLVVLAHFSGDENICRAFKDGTDIHTETASLVFRKSPIEITQKERNVAKQINFSLIYGKGAFGLSQDLDISIKEAKEFIDIYFGAFPKLKSYFETTIKTAREWGYVKTIFNQRRFIPELNDRNMQIQKMGERLAMNTPIQGSSADILKKAMVDLHNEFSKKTNDVRALLQIHDEILFEIKEDVLQESMTKIKYIMENAVKLQVPIRANVKYGKNWAELK